jgi:hypothetical protein
MKRTVGAYVNQLVFCKHNKLIIILHQLEGKQSPARKDKMPCFPVRSLCTKQSWGIRSIWRRLSVVIYGGWTRHRGGHTCLVIAGLGWVHCRFRPCFLLLLHWGYAGAEMVSQKRVSPSLILSGMLQNTQNWCNLWWSSTLPLTGVERFTPMEFAYFQTSLFNLQSSMILTLIYCRQKSICAEFLWQKIMSTLAEQRVLRFIAFQIQNITRAHTHF